MVVVTLARKLYKPTGRPVIVYGPTGGHSHAPRGVRESTLMENLAGSFGRSTTPAAPTVPVGRSRK